MHALEWRDEGVLEPLTPRELEVLQLLAEGMTSVEIAAKHEVRFKTARNQRTAIYGKLGAVNAANAVAIALRNGVIE